MKEITISCETAGVKPNYKASAAALLIACREFYQNPENEKAYMDSTRTGCGSE